MDTSIDTSREATSGHEQPRRAAASVGLSVIDSLMAGGELLPAQLPVASHWSPEKRLAAAVLASALVEIRDHHGSSGAPPPQRRGVRVDRARRRELALLVRPPLRAVRARGRLGPRRGRALGDGAARGPQVDQLSLSPGGVTAHAPRPARHRSPATSTVHRSPYRPLRTAPRLSRRPPAGVFACTRHTPRPSALRAGGQYRSSIVWPRASSSAAWRVGATAD